MADNHFKLPVLGADDSQAPSPSTSPYDKPGFSRRDFLQLSGAASLTTLVACRPPHDTVKPYVTKPEDVIPGNPLHFTSAMSLDGIANGLVVTSFEGRPTKIEGNARHPMNGDVEDTEAGGPTGIFEQAAHIGLYDPSRAKVILNKRHGASREHFFAFLKQKGETWDNDGGAKLRLLLEPSSSPMLGQLLTNLKLRFPNAKVYFHSPSASDSAVDGAQVAFGQPHVSRYDLKDADVIVSLDSDFLAATPDTLPLSRQFAERRDPAREMNRLYVAEARMSVTGSTADHRLPMKSGEVGLFARELLGAVAKRVGNASLSGLSSGNGVGSVTAKQIEAIASDLVRSKGKSAVLVGKEQPASVHAIGLALNELLDNLGKTVEIAASPLLDPHIGSAPLKALIDEINSGAVETLICTTFDPLYAKPVDLDVAAAFGKVPSLIYSASHVDRTAELAEWFVPASHFLESWGAARSYDGTVSIQQPLISPLYNSLTIEEMLSALVPVTPGFNRPNDAEAWRKIRGLIVALDSHALARSFWASEARSEGFDNWWARTLQQGFVEGTALAPAEVHVNVDEVATAAKQLPPVAAFEVNIRTDYKVWDGRFAGNPLLQELPDPISKLTWDNAVYMSAATAKKLNVEREQVVEVTANGKTINGAVLVMPGHADDSVTLMLGYGQHFGEANVGNDEVRIALGEKLRFEGDDDAGIGFNAYLVRSMVAPWFMSGEVKGRSEYYPLAVTQGHFSQEDRKLVLAFDKEEFEKKNGAEVKEVLDQVRGDLPTLYDRNATWTTMRGNTNITGAAIPDPVRGQGVTYQWAMGVDLSRCTGCSACVIACVSENNIPIVGKTHVRKGREMHWLRIDRYYLDNAKSEQNPDVVSQPTMCQHCENAPCEYVCPVNATMHSEEGLNEMIYNRCVGTRYCSNNCPYKVRRFNFFNYTGDRSATEEMAMNPDVTVRSRGVMEKCTYCVQRIERSRIGAEIAGNELEYGDVRTACQQACPTHAISFGSLTKPGRITEMHGSERRYDLLHGLGTRPRTAYLARATNRNPELA
jgi:molybdopterin-containing oxidoreductase family iron-sulfur binding subunit